MRRRKRRRKAQRRAGAASSDFFMFLHNSQARRRVIGQSKCMKTSMRYPSRIMHFWTVNTKLCAPSCCSTSSQVLFSRQTACHPTFSRTLSEA